MENLSKDPAENAMKTAGSLPLGGSSLLLAVADGIGGHLGGDIAAQIIIDSLKHLRFQTGISITRQLKHALWAADASINEAVEQQPELRGMGATVTAAYIEGYRVRWVHIGDSRLYLLRKAQLKQITLDHTYVQHLSDQGKLTVDEAANHPQDHVLEQCIGAIDLGIDSDTFKLTPGDCLLLCTDGLYKGIPKDQLSSFFNFGHTPSEQVDNLLQTISQISNHDDATVVITHTELNHAK